MLLSFCIPTYNRCEFLKKNISIIIDQIRELHLENEVEIFVSDNASPDATEQVCKELMHISRDIQIGYKKNETNIGPDRNYIQVMRMATGTFSILYGDDDYLVPGALARIIEMVQMNDCSIYLTNRKCIDSGGNYIGEDVFIESPTKSIIVDFTNMDSVRSYFYGVNTMGGVLAFISSVVYRTDMLIKYELDERVMTTHYSYLQYWWSDLLAGGKLYYSNEVLVLATTIAVTNNNHGLGVDRVTLDYQGYLTIADVVFNKSPYKKYFLKAIDTDHSDFALQRLYILNKKEFEAKLSPILLQAGWSDSRLAQLKESVSLKKILIYIKHGYILPYLKRQ